MQTLHTLALEPIAEVRANKNSYGFRPKRSTADAIAQCFNTLAQKMCATWILEADIKSCFDKISHAWLLKSVPMDKEMLGKWLSAGYIDKDVFHQTEEGTPQGGTISPTLLNLTLSGLEEAILNATSKYKDKVNCIIYADDFIITGASKEVLEQKVKPTVESFLQERGLALSQEKTRITHIDDGFDFLGANIRKYKGKLLIKPSKKSTQNFLNNIRDVIKSNRTEKTENLIQQLNPKIRGWANFHRHICAKRTFSYVDSQIFQMLWNWVKRRHPMKSRVWLNKKYFRQHKLQNWIFFAKTVDEDGVVGHLDLIKASATPIKRHIKVKADAIPFDPVYREYFAKRESKASKIWKWFKEA